MPFVIDDRVQQTAVVGGLGNVIFAGSGAVSGFDTFGSHMSIGDTTWIFIFDPTSFLWEVDIATYASGDQLQRTAVLDSSTGGKVNFPGNTCQVAMTIPAAFVRGAIPGGVNGQVQYNNGGTLGGLTNVELLATALSGSAYTFGTVSFGAGSTAANGTITFTLDQPVAAHVLKVTFSNGSAGGSITATVEVNGTPVTGLSAVVVNATGTATATGANEVTAGSAVTLVLSAASGTIEDGGAITISGTID